MKGGRDMPRRGFVLLEILPALLLVVGALLLGGRLVGVRLRAEEVRLRMALRDEAVLLAWEHWQDRGGGLLLATWREDGWELVEVPSENWLPDEPVASRGHWIIRRQLLVQPDGAEAWLLASRSASERGQNWRSWGWVTRGMAALQK